MNASKSDITDLCEYIVASDIFGRSSKKRKIFSYIVNEELAGRGRELKEYNIAIDALKYPESFNPQIDSSIRAEMYRLRKDIEAASDQLEQFKVKISFKKGSYRPHFSSEERKLTYKRPIMFAAMFALISAVFFLYHNYSQNQTLLTDCPSGRPVISLDFTAHSFPESELLLLERYLKQYQLFHIPEAGYKCKVQNSPTFVVSANVAARGRDKELIINVRESVSNALAFSDIISLPTNSDDLKINLAKTAYELAHPSQKLAQKSLDFHWNDLDKKNQYKCIVGIFDYFIEYDLKLYNHYYECMKTHHDTPNHLVEVDAMLAYLYFEQFRGYVPATKEKPENLFWSFTLEAQSKNGDHPEVKLMALRKQFYENPKISKWRILSTLEGILDGQEYNPHILNQTSFYYGTWIDEWDLAMRLSERAAQLDSSAQEIWHRTYGFKALLDDDPKIAFEKISQLDFHASKIPNIIALCSALQVNNDKAISIYKVHLSKLGFTSKRHIIDEINSIFPIKENRARKKLLSILEASDLK